MSSRLSFTLLFAVSIPVAGAFGFTACSSTEDATPTPDGGVEAGGDAKPAPDAFVPPTDSGTKLTPEQCEAQCFVDHAGAKAKYEGVDTCWEAKCKGPCVDDTGLYDGGTQTEAGADAGDEGLCGTEYGSGISDACDNCTTDNCCSEWTACYGSKDCQDLDDCIGKCYE